MRRLFPPRRLGHPLIRGLTACALFLVITGWASRASHAASTAPSEAAAPSAIPQMSEYRIGPLDILGITVFPVKDLTLDKVQVDASGQIVLPLIGVVDAKGKTARELSAEIASKLDASYLRDAQVSVLVVDAASQRVTVEGAVTEAGVFPLHGRASLLQAVALAKGPSHTADLKHVTVFRDVDGKRAYLTYNFADIRSGKASDPEILGGDEVVVPTSKGGAMFQNAIAASPMLYLLAVFH